MAGGKIYLRERDGLVAMTEAPYDAEHILQTLLSDYPDLLAGDQMRPGEPRRWLHISREAGIPGAEGGGSRWSLDHLFIDQDAVPTLVEVKRSSDTRIRREVVGQMLEYAANVVTHWPGERLRALFEERPRPDGTAPEHEVLEFVGAVSPSEPEVGASDTVDEFWGRAASNLAARQVRLVFVADVIPPELQRIVEFLNENLIRTEVLAVEVKQYVGEGRQTLVPRVIGHTAAADDVKQPVSSPRRSRVWTEEEVFAALADDPEATGVVRNLLAWAAERRLIVEGTEMIKPGLVWRLDALRNKYRFFTIDTGFKQLNIQSNSLSRKPILDDPLRRAALFAALRTRFTIPDDRIDKVPAISMAELAHDAAFETFTEAWDAVIEDLRRAEAGLR